MPIELYLAFVLATLILMVTPGPNMTLTIANSLAYGPGRAMFTVLGAGSAMILHLSIVAIGLSWLMGALSTGFELLRWAGVAYLLYLGILEWRRARDAVALAAPLHAPAAKLWLQGFLVCASNPKVLLFYIAFFPQFLDPTAPAGGQLLLLSVTFVLLAVACDGTLALLAGRARRWLPDRRGVQLRHRLTGTLLIGTALGLAALRR